MLPNLRTPWEASISAPSTVPGDAHGTVGARSERPAAECAAGVRPSGGQAGHVYVVTVTYGDRRHLLRPVLTSLLEEEAISRIVVVSNGAQWDVCSLVKELAPRRIVVVKLPKNLGSAVGFRTGIKTACDLGAEFVWLLDDDNLPEKGALSGLLSGYVRLSADFPESGLAVVAFRPERRPDLAIGRPRRFSSFWGLHILDVPLKLWRRMPWGRLHPQRTLPAMVAREFVPYSGMLFRRALVEAHGLPRADFVLYGDDVEFTYRITQGGGTIRVITSARVSDLEGSWIARSRHGLPFRGWLEDGSDARAFYAAREETYVGSHCLPHSKLVFWINRQIYCLALWTYAVALQRLSRYRLLRLAIRDGLAGRLGMHPDHPL